MTAPVLFILGAGPKIGLSVANAFAAKGYKIALASRSVQDGVGEDGYLRLQVDLSNPAQVQGAFAKVKEQLGIPSVVVYNAAERIARDAKDPLASVSLDEVNREFSTNTFSPLFAAKEAVSGFKQLPSSASKTFIFTGNALNVIVLPGVLTFGMTKGAAAQLIKFASVAYQGQGFKFYYVDERQPDGGPTIPVGGLAAGKMYVELAENKEQGPWDYTFIDGKGYVDFTKA
ncbi:putative short-chain dehydrogenase [Rhizodiscina lignyota]|uniref:Short-chain dehydrogenase n=1 Tax=Rhizodiscina lignyota TaxID=1504668 RepID=A0A9P4MC16_9PEZI|nr:putative short-chain dehydrogenase [Rhizodiscina lignyota]